MPGPSSKPDTVNKPLNERLSRIVYLALTTDADGVVTVGEIMDRVAERGFGLFLFLLAIPVMIPVLPPGASGVVGMMYMALGLQLVAGKSHPWLPRRVRAYALTPRIVAALQSRGVAIMERLERLSRPRMRFMDQPGVLRVVGVFIIMTGFVMWLPLPLMNSVPAFALLVIAIGLLNRDGAFVLAGSVMGLGTLSFVSASVHLLVSSLGWVRDLF
ncbi:MAG TPA: exopolysaccharide biosynthesis protein [Chthonomonadales bacterium]|nr:exopolysaccharide biosynthesis protein [Chthonomonadales bacterium]